MADKMLATSRKSSVFMGIYKQILILLLFLGMGGVVSSIYGFILDFIVFLLCIPLTLLNKTFINKKEFLFLLFFASWFCASAVFTATPINCYFGIYFRFFCGILLLNSFNHNFDEMRYYVNKGLWIICVIAFINYILVYLSPSLFQAREFDSGRTYYSIAYIFNYIPPAAYEIFTRNQGPFIEAGVLQLFLNLLILDELILKRKSISSLWLPIIVMITTFSTTGFILMMIIILWGLLFINDKNKTLYKRITILFLVSILFLPLITENFSMKFTGEGSGSSALRLYDFTMGMQIIRENPVFGIGMDLTRYYKYNDYISMAFYNDMDINLERGNSNTFMGVGMHFGLLILILYLIAIFKQNIYSCKRLFAVVYIIACVSEPFTFAVFNIVITLSALCHRERKLHTFPYCIKR